MAGKPPPFFAKNKPKAEAGKPAAKPPAKGGNPFAAKAKPDAGKPAAKGNPFANMASKAKPFGRGQSVGVGSSTNPGDRRSREDPESRRLASYDVDDAYLPDMPENYYTRPGSEMSRAHVETDETRADRDRAVGGGQARSKVGRGQAGKKGKCSGCGHTC